MKTISRGWIITLIRLVQTILGYEPLTDIQKEKVMRYTEEIEKKYKLDPANIEDLEDIGRVVVEQYLKMILRKELNEGKDRKKIEKLINKRIKLEYGMRRELIFGSGYAESAIELEDTMEEELRHVNKYFEPEIRIENFGYNSVLCNII